MANNSSNPTCPHLEWYLNVGEKLYFIVSYIIGPIYFLFGTAIHSVCLKAFLNETKKEKAYLYQVYLTIGRIWQSVFLPVYTLAYWWASSSPPGTAWFRSCYWCMWATVKVILPLASIGATLLTLFSLLVSADRLYALWKPLAYSKSYEKRNNSLIVFVVVCVAIVSSTSLCFRYLVVPVGNSSVYQLIQNVPFMYALHGTLLYHMRTLTDWTWLVSMYFCGVATVWFFHKRVVLSEVASNLSDAEARRRAQAQRTLALLAISQSLCFTVTITAKNVFAVLVSLTPLFLLCQGNTFFVTMCAFIDLMDLADIAFVFIICKPFRTAILRSLGYNAKGNTVKVAPVVPIRQRSK